MKTSRGLSNPWTSIAWFTSFGSLFTAIAFLLAYKYNLPPTDGAYSEPAILTILNPFAVIVWVPITIISAVLVYPVAFICLRKSDLMKSFGLVMLIVVIEIVVVTPLNPACGWLGVYPATVVALLLCRKLLPLTRA